MCETTQELEASLSRIVKELDASLLAGRDAKTLVGLFSRLEHLAAAGKAICALRVASTGVFEAEGHRHASEWLAAESGESLGAAVSVLEAAAAVSQLAELDDAFRSGELSAAQAKEVAGAAICDPASTTELLDAAKSGGFETLRRRCAEIKAATASKEDEAARTRRIHAARRLRTWTESDGTFRLDARLSQDAGARVLAGLEGEADKIFAEARRSGAREPSQAYLADALVALVTSPGMDGAHTAPRRSCTCEWTLRHCAVATQDRARSARSPESARSRSQPHASLWEIRSRRSLSRAPPTCTRSATSAVRSPRGSTTPCWSGTAAVWCQGARPLTTSRSTTASYRSPRAVRQSSQTWRGSATTTTS